MREFGPLRELTEKLELPPESVSPVLRVTLYGRQQVLVEHHRGLLAYSDSVIETAGVRMRLRILGRGLTLGSMDRDTLLIKGEIQAVEYA